jgi:hypothetical protein
VAALLRRSWFIIGLLLLLGCSAPWSTHQSISTPAPSSSSTTSIVASEPSNSQSTPTTASSFSSAAATGPTVASSPTSTSPATQVSVATPTPTFSVVAGPVARCCGVFNWADSLHLFVYDTPADATRGSYLVDVQNGERQFIVPSFGTLSKSGLIALSNTQAGTTEIRSLDGSIVSTVHNGGRETWISPDGRRVTWLVDQGTSDTSSLVPRVVQVVSANIDGTNQKSLVTLKTSSLQWLPDNIHVLAIARAQDGTRAGIWEIDTTNGTNGVLVPGTYIQSLRLSPDGAKIAYLVTFSGDTAHDGVWIANANGSGGVHLNEFGAFRWGGDSNHLWFLQLAAAGAGQDHLKEVNVANDSTEASVAIGGRILNDQWEINSGGNVVAFWNEANQTVLVATLSP